MSSNYVVDPNSVQAQFASLSRDRDRLRQATTSSDVARGQEEERLHILRAAQSSLTDKIRTAHATLGTENKKRQLLQDEERRLRTVMANDRHSIVEIKDELCGMEQEEHARKKKYVQEMDTLNDEMDRAIKSYTDKLVLKMISVDVIDMLLKTKVKDEVEKESRNAANYDTSTGEQLNDDSYEQDSSSLQWKELETKLKESLELIQEATVKRDSEVDTQSKLKNELLALRTKMIQEGRTIDDRGERLGEMEIEEMERMWEEAWEESDEAKYGTSFHGDGPSHLTNAPQDQSSNNSDEPLNMGLFYGNGDNVTHDDRDEVNI